MQEGKVEIAEERREVKGNGEGDRYTQLKAEFQRIARRDKKAFLNEQCKEIEDSDRMGKTKDLFKKIGAIKGTFHARMSTIKDRNSKDLTETEEIKKLQEYTELYKKKKKNYLITQKATVVWSLMWSQILCSMKSSRPYEALL